MVSDSRNSKIGEKTPKVNNLFGGSGHSTIPALLADKGTTRFLLSRFKRIIKEHRAAGVLENFAEGEKYKENFLRRYVRGRAPEIMPSLNKFFTDPK